jgi:hypothetical protein
MNRENQNYEPAIIANFEFVENKNPIEATFSISPNIQDLNYIHYQDTPSNKWIIVHNLGKFPSVSITNSAGEQVIADVIYKSLNEVEVNCIGAFAGVAYLN